MSFLMERKPASLPVSRSLHLVTPCICWIAYAASRRRVTQGGHAPSGVRPPPRTRTAEKARPPASVAAAAPPSSREAASACGSAGRGEGTGRPSASRSRDGTAWGRAGGRRAGRGWAWERRSRLKKKNNACTGGGAPLPLLFLSPLRPSCSTAARTWPGGWWWCWLAWRRSASRRAAGAPVASFLLRKRTGTAARKKKRVRACPLPPTLATDFFFSVGCPAPLHFSRAMDPPSRRWTDSGLPQVSA